MRSGKDKLAWANVYFPQAQASQGAEVPTDVSSTLTYDGNGKLATVTTELGTKTFAYNPDGTLATITGTGVYVSKSFTYTDGKLANVTVS